MFQGHIRIWEHSKLRVIRLRISRIGEYFERNSEERIYQLTIWPHCVNIGYVGFSQNSNFFQIPRVRVTRILLYICTVPGEQYVNEYI